MSDVDGMPELPDLQFPPIIPADRESGLLPCPVCGSSVKIVNSGTISCHECKLSLFGNRGLTELIQRWNTRTIRGHELLFFRSLINEVAPVRCWCVIHGAYLYGPSEQVDDVIQQILTEWEHDRNLVG